MCLMAAGLMSVMTSPAAAEVICQESALLGNFDSNKDGVVSSDEIRAADPNNTRLQEIAAELEARGVDGIRYAGCDGSGTGTTPPAGGDGEGTTPPAGDGGAGTDTSAGDGGAGTDTAGGEGTDNTSSSGGEAADVSDAADELLVTVLPETGQGSPSNQNAPMILVALGAAGLVALSAPFAIRLRQRG